MDMPTSNPEVSALDNHGAPTFSSEGAHPTNAQLDESEL